MLRPLKCSKRADRRDVAGPRARQYQAKTTSTTNDYSTALAQPLLPRQRDRAQRVPRSTNTRPSQEQDKSHKRSSYCRQKQMRGSTASRALPERGIPNHTSGGSGRGGYQTVPPACGVKMLRPPKCSKRADTRDVAGPRARQDQAETTSTKQQTTNDYSTALAQPLLPRQRDRAQRVPRSTNTRPSQERE